MCSLCVPLSVGLVPALRQGVVHVFSLCAPVCWFCAGITSGGSFCVGITWMCCHSLLNSCRHYTVSVGSVMSSFLMCSLCCTPVC